LYRYFENLLLVLVDFESQKCRQQRMRLKVLILRPVLGSKAQQRRPFFFVFFMHVMESITLVSGPQSARGESIRDSRGGCGHHGRG